MENAWKWLALIQLLYGGICSAVEPTVQFGGYHWKSIGDNILEIATQGGEEALLVQQRDADGLVVLQDAAFTAGVIELDVAAIDRSPPELVFALDEQATEFDSVLFSFWPYFGDSPYHRLKQLTLTTGDRSQLVCLIHRGESDTPPQDLQWMHVSMKIADDVVAITIDHDERPCVVIGNPFHHCSGDRFGLRGSGYFRNIEFRPAAKTDPNKSRP